MPPPPLIRRLALFACLGWLPPQGPPSADPAATAAAALRDYRAGRYAAAHQGLQAAAAGFGDAAPDALLYDLALAAARAGRGADAAAAAARLEARGAAADAAFLDGLAEHQRYLDARRAAALDDAEPMAWTAAVRAAERAAAAFRRAAELHGDWPAARRNAERLQRLAAAARAERDRATPPPPTPAPAPDPQPAPTAAGPETAPPPAPVAPLSAAEVAELWQRLGAKEREKRQVRGRQQAAAAAPGERDW